MMTNESHERRQTRGEEIANSVSHGLGLLGAITAFPFLVVVIYRAHDATAVAAACAFAGSLVLLYLTSTLFHALPHCRAKRVFQILDHAAIYVLIAGTYTPFALGVLHGVRGWVLFGLVWGMAVAGTILKSVGGTRYNTLSTLAYLAMGWLVLIVADLVWARVPFWGLVWLGLGGLLYTAGVAFFLAEGRRYFHFIWHLFVLAGSLCHVFAVMWYAN